MLTCFCPFLPSLKKIHSLPPPCENRCIITFVFHLLDHNHYLQTLIWVKFSDCFFSWLVLLVVPFKEKLLQKSYLCIWCTWSSDEPSIITESTCIHTHLYTIEFWVEEHKGVWSRDIIKIPVILNTNKKATPWFQIWSICWQKKQ